MTAFSLTRHMGAALLGLAAAAVAHAADAFPSKPIHVVVPYAAGGTTDQIARVIQQPMSDALGQPIIIDNKPGAGGTIGTDAVVRSAADGYTLDFGNNGPNELIGLMRQIPYDPVKDLRPVSLVAVTPMFFAVPADSPAKTLEEFIAFAKANPGKLNIGSVGQGSFSHVTAEYFKQLAGLDLLHVPYNGGAPLMAAFAGNQIHAAFVTGLDGETLRRSGKVRYLAVATPQPSALMPGMPTVASVIPGFKSAAWFGLFVPKTTPDDVVAKLNGAIIAALGKPEVQRFFIERRAEARGTTPAEFEAFIRDDVSQWTPVIKKADIRL